MKYTIIIWLLLLISCHQGAKEKKTPESKLREIEIVEKNIDTIETYQTPIKFKSRLRPKEPLLLNKIYTDTITFEDYNDDYDYRYLNGIKNGGHISLVYNWDWTENEDYNFRQGDLIAVQWKMDSLVTAGDEEVVAIVERAVDAKKIVSGNQPIQFLKREDRYDEAVKAAVSAMVINQTYLHNITPAEKAALAFIAYDIGNECEWGYDSEGNGRVLWCQIVSALNLGHQCSDTQLNFLRKWFTKDTVALKKFQSCPTLPNTATVQSTFDEILVQTDEMDKTITVSYKVTGFNMRESKSWQWSQTDFFKYGEDYIVLANSKKSEVTEDTIVMNPDNPDNQKYVLALKDYLVQQWSMSSDFELQKVTFINGVLALVGKEGFQLSSYDFNNIIINKDKKSGKINVTVYHIGGGAAVMLLLPKTMS